MLNDQNISILEDFKQYVRVKNYKGRIRNFEQPVEEFLTWIQQRGIQTLNQVSHSIIRDYYQYLSNRPNRTRAGVLSDSSINNHLHALKILNERLLESKVLDIAMLIPRKVNSTQIERVALTVQEVQEMYKICDTSFETVLLHLSYGCGLRRSETVNLRLCDLKLSEGYLIVSKGKGGKRREVPMSDKIIEDIRTYIIGDRADCLKKFKRRNDYLLLNSIGRNVGGDVLNNRVKELVKKTKNYPLQSKRVTLHSMRHSIATHLIENGATMEFIRTFLGHSELDTSQIYARRRKRHNVFKV